MRDVPEKQQVGLVEQHRRLSEGIRGAASCGNWDVTWYRQGKGEGRGGGWIDGWMEGRAVMNGRKDEDAAGEAKWLQHSTPLLNFPEKCTNAKPLVEPYITLGSD